MKKISASCTGVARIFDISFRLPCVDSRIAHATTIIVIWTPDKIILAADSQGTCIDEGGKVVDCANAQNSLCKIGSEGLFYCAVAGLYSYPVTRFDIRRLAHDAYGRGAGNPDLRTFQMNLFDSIGTALAEARESAAIALRKNPNLNYGEFTLGTPPFVPTTTPGL